MIITLTQLPDLPKKPMPQIEGETAEAVQAKYPGATVYVLAHDYTVRVWVDTAGQDG